MSCQTRKKGVCWEASWQKPSLPASPTVYSLFEFQVQKNHKKKEKKSELLGQIKGSA